MKVHCAERVMPDSDPPRPQSRGAVLQAREAGVTVRMVTGDHPATAAAIAKTVAIIDNTSSKSAVTTGQAFDALSEDEIDALPDLPLVIARCAPETKVRLIEALHRRKIYGMTRFCVMTGDGVNDAPALKRADCGIGGWQQRMCDRWFNGCLSISHSHGSQRFRRC